MIRRGSLLALFLPLAACGNAVQHLGIPGARTPFSVQRATPRGGYLDVLLTRDGLDTRVFTPDDEPCRTLLTVGAAFVQPDLETGGKITGPGISCELAGIGSLEQHRQPRPTGFFSPRGQATLKVVYVDEEVILARGRFPLTSLVGWAGGGDSVAVLPNTKTCRDRAAGGVATLEWRPSGDPLLLVGDEPCPLLGLVRPL